MAPIRNQRGKLMWPSLPTANHIADVANWFFIGSLVVGVVATILIVWMAGIKEAYWEKDRTESAERIAVLGIKAEELRKETAEATARALEAKLELAKFKLDRTLSDEQKSRIIEKLKAFAGQEYVLSVSTDQEAIRFVRGSLDPVFKTSHWVKLPAKGTVSIPDIDAGVNVAGEPGVRVQIAQHRADDPELITRIYEVSAALNAEGIDATPALTPDMDDTPNAIQIRVGSKPK
jgi:hypothetical protein